MMDTKKNTFDLFHVLENLDAMPSFRITGGTFIQRNLKVTAEYCPTKTQDIPNDNRDGCECDLMI